MTSSFPPGVRLPGDGDRAAQHHPMSGQCPSPPAACRAASSPAPHPRGAPATGDGHAQQWQAVRGRGARPAGTETGPGGRPGGPRLHTHSRLPRVPQVPGPAGAAVSSPQRGEPGVGEDHQQQRARVAPGAPNTCRPAGEARGPAGGAPRSAGSRPCTASTLLVGARIQELAPKSAEPAAPARASTGVWELGPPRDVAPQWRGDALPPDPKDPSSPSGPFPPARITESGVGVPAQTCPENWWHHQWNFP